MRAGAMTLVLAAVLVLAPVAVGQAPTQDSVTGSAIYGLNDGGDDVLATIDAHSSAGGEDPRGSVSLDHTNASSRFHEWGGIVTCLRVEGNRAVLATYGDVNEGLPGELARPISLVEVIDNGSPGIGHDKLIVSSSPVGVGTPEDVPITDCPEPSSDVFQGGYPGVLGPFEPNYVGYTGPQDFVVTDARPPSTYAECRHAGWVHLGYSSHATCIASVHNWARSKCIFERVGRGIVAFRAKYGFPPDQNHAMRHCVRLYTGF